MHGASTAADLPWPRRVSSASMDVEAVERSYASLLAALGDLVVARSRGEPADPGAGSTTTLARRYRARRRAFDSILDALAGSAGSELATEDARAVANMRATLPWADELEPTPGARQVEGGTTDEEPATARARARLFDRYGRAADAIRIDAGTVDRPTVLARLATEPDRARRRALFEAMDPVWRTVDGDGGESSPYRRLVRASASRWAVHGSPIEANAIALGLPAGSLEPMLWRILAAWRRVLGPARVEPWDLRYVAGAAARKLDGLVPSGRLLDLNRAYLASLGADPVASGIRYDVLPRPGRPLIPVAFTLGMGADDTPAQRPGAWTPRPPWVFATYAEGGVGNLLELLHESGHAIHMAAIRTRPAYLDFPESSAAFLEGTADVLGWDADEPAWQTRWLGSSAEVRDAMLSRYVSVMLDVCWALFEIEVHRHPDRRPNDVWTEVTADGLGVEPHPEWSWWALRGQLIDGPGYLANYALSAIMAAAVRERISTIRGEWFDGDPGWYRFVADGLFVAGASKSPAVLLETFLGGPLTEEPLLADLARGE